MLLEWGTPKLCDGRGPPPNLLDVWDPQNKMDTPKLCDGWGLPPNLLDVRGHPPNQLDV